MAQTDVDKKVYDLGNVRPEGIEILPQTVGQTLGLGDGAIALVTQLYWGGIDAVNLVTGESKKFLESPKADFGNPSAAGIKFHNGAIWVAGGMDGDARVYGIDGTEIAKCDFGLGGFVNDMAFIGDIVYFTNSFVSSLTTLNVSAALAGNCETGTFPVQGFEMTNNFNLNGIVPYGSNSLLINSLALGAVYSLDLDDTTGLLKEMISAPDVLGADGMVIVTSDDNKDRLYVAQNLLGGEGSVDSIGIYDLDGEVATFVESLTSSGFDQPATIALDDAGEYIYTVNARFVSLPNPDPAEGDLTTFGEKFTMVGVMVPQPEHNTKGKKNLKKIKAKKSKGKNIKGKKKQKNS